MAGDYGKNQGGVQSSTSTEFDPIESGTPKTGFQEAPASACGEKGPGPGVPGNTKKIH